MDVSLIFLGWILFAGTHIGMSADPYRPRLVARLGELPFMGLYSVISLATFGFLIWAFVTYPHAGPIVLGAGADSSLLQFISFLLAGAGLIVLLSGLLNKSALGMMGGTMEPTGIIRITRHPINMAFALWGFSHLLVNRSLGDWIFFGGFVLFGWLGSAHQDKKVNRLKNGALDGYLAGTSILPFGAVISGRQPLKLGELNKIAVVVGLAAAIGSWIAH